MTRIQRYGCWTALAIGSITLVNCFAPNERRHWQQTEVPSSTQLHLVPLSRFQGDLSSFFSDEQARCGCLQDDGSLLRDAKDDDDDNTTPYLLCLAEEGDLSDLSRLIVVAFGADAIRLSQDLNAFERLLMNPAAEFMNDYSGVVAYVEVLLGLTQRLASRMEDGAAMDISAPILPSEGNTSELLKAASKQSLLIILARPSMADDKAIDVIASVELRLELTDAKIPFSLPWLDRVERQVASLVGLGAGGGKSELQPYLSSLCVDERFRGQKIGRALVHCVETIAAHWGYSRLYLHVDPDNKAAFNLYHSEGYRDVGKRWNPFWAGNSANIGYFCKTLKDGR